MKPHVFFATAGLVLVLVLVLALAPAYGQKPADPSLVAAKLAAAAEKVSARQVVVGRPFSATEERHTLQVLADGTRIESRQTNRFYRDSDGRTRLEEQGGNITLLDPVAGFSAILDPSGTRIVKKANLSPTLAEQQAADLKKMEAMNRKTGSLGTEVLSPQTIGGVLANGTRTTTTIPAGAIGNDRPINVITERWYSEDLQILVKSTNSDPRFGDTVYEVTNIVQGPVNPDLFLVPAVETIPAALDKLRALAEAERKKKEAANAHE
jgi:hypothetical protein